MRELRNLLSDPTAQVVFSVAILLIFMAIGYYVAQFFRNRMKDSGVNSSELLTNFQELRREGNITEAEFRTIKNVLGEKLQDELKDASGEG